VIEEERTLPEPSPEALDGPKKTTRRGSRGGRGRRKPTDGLAESADATGATEEAPPAEEAVEAPVRAPRRSRAKATEGSNGVLEDTLEAPVRKTTSRKAAAPAQDDAEAAPAPAARRAKVSAGEPSAADFANLVRLVEAQGKQLEQLARNQEAVLKRAGGGSSGSSAPPARVGVFVDAANVELAIDRMRGRVDWGKVLNLLTENRTLVRATAYSPVHDDPNVSIETQRFAEPFLHKGYKVVTKPLKRFADGTIKANVDIEMACDIIEMLDRLDVVCLVSGDGDFQRLVEVIQGKGVRVEVVAVGTSTASSLRNAADQFTDLQAIIGKVKA
jgi:uncharacterized LabA/DUF88 family protein